jgi:hypothetical protein
MFNPLKPEDMLIAIGRVLRSAADANEPLDDYGRSQLLSAYSIARNLAAEQGVQGELLLWLQAQLDPLLVGTTDAAIEKARVRVAQAHDGRAMGEAVSELLARLRPDPDRYELRRRVQGALREVVEREVASLAAAPR